MYATVMAMDMSVALAMDFETNRTRVTGQGFETKRARVCLQTRTLRLSTDQFDSPISLRDASSRSCGNVLRFDRRYAYGVA